ncbi:MAG: DinB family protein [Pseudomonadota bacterium]
MITPAYAQLMARYNRWQNESLYAAADGLSDAARRADRGAFFGSIHATLSHLQWGDRIWLHRLAGAPRPAGAGIEASLGAATAWQTLLADRVTIDGQIDAWTAALDTEALSGVCRWFSGAIGRELSRPVPLLVMQFFNHQTHHRGQVHAMLTAAGARPDDTDIPFMPGLE